MEKIFHQKDDTVKFETLYDACYVLVSQQHGKALYKMFNESIKKYLISDVLPLVKGDLIVTLRSIWEDYAMALQLLGDIFMYLNRSYCSEAQLPSVQKCGELLFRDCILRSGEVVNRLYAQFEEAMNAERDQKPINHHDLKVITTMLTSLPSGVTDESEDMFSKELLPLLIEGAKSYYKTKLAASMLDASDALTVLESLNNWFERERTTSFYMPEGSPEAITESLERELLPDALKKIFNSPTGLALWIEHDNLAALSLAAELESKAGEADSELVSTLRGVLRSRQLEINEVAQRTYNEGGSKALSGLACDWVQATVDLKKNFDKIFEHVSKSFSDRKSVKATFDAIWTDCLNKCSVKGDSRGSSAPEFLVIFVDDALKKSSKVHTDADIERTLDDAMILFEAIVEKDAFSTNYNLRFGRRLLQNKSQSEELERNFISRLKRSGGHANTSAFERMLNDLNSNQTLNRGFKAKYSPEIATKNTVITLQMWHPSFTKQKVSVLPDKLEKVKEDYEEFYLSQHSSRKLMWNFKLSSADVQLNIGDTSYIIWMPLFCVSVVFLFQGEEEYTAEEISQKTQITNEDLYPCLQALSQVPKQRLLVKSPASGAVSAGDKFRFNHDFKSPKRYIKLAIAASVSRSEHAKEQSEAMTELRVDRDHLIDAKIVRVMKARQTLKHEVLLEEVGSQLSSVFQPTAADIKRCIGGLIERDYLMRDKKDPNTYIYLA